MTSGRKTTSVNEARGKRSRVVENLTFYNSVGRFWRDVWSISSRDHLLGATGRLAITLTAACAGSSRRASKARDIRQSLHHVSWTLGTDVNEIWRQPRTRAVDDAW